MSGKFTTVECVLVFDRKELRLVDIEWFHHGPSACEAFFEREKQYLDQPHIEVQLLGAASEEAVRSAYPLYFQTDWSWERFFRDAQKLVDEATLVAESAPQAAAAD